MKTDKTEAPQTITEEALDEISGGPHWQSWNPPAYVTAQERDRAQTMDAASPKFSQVAIKGTS